MKKDYQTPSLLLLALYGGNALCQTSGGTIGEGGDFIWGETTLTEPEQ